MRGPRLVKYCLKNVSEVTHKSLEKRICNNYRDLNNVYVTTLPRVPFDTNVV
jgi:hypothetical protein